ncbi:hypothetical protein C0966_08150 [Bacillus methanolicus]|uniref:nucleotidyltransferase domain-containing protein n=1 Tax=Bacillus methanolicus TaxID=1471 RepID=UPI00238066EE|nr:nucleotidyltransferase domain-containing protein [Bacillus methanolicus]MDE3839325.1 hypothetical protein [Bacillus methanolicus]
MNDWLNELEKRYEIEILFACEAGSRAWGTHSDDSDFDIRFIYRFKNIKKYLSIDPPKDVLDLTDQFDIHGWDIFKAMQLLRKSNPSLFEWAYSPVVYVNKHTFRETLQYMIETGYSPYSLFMHYMQVMSRNVKDVKNKENYDDKRQKQLLQAIKAFLIALRLYEKNKVSNELLNFLSQPEMEKDVLYNQYSILVKAKQEKTLLPYLEVKEMLDYLEKQKEILIEYSKKLHKGTNLTGLLNNWLWELLQVKAGESE